MAKLIMRIEPASFTYYKGLASLVGMDLAEVAHRGMLKELQSIEKAMFAKQQELAREESTKGATNETGVEVTEAANVGEAITDSDSLAD